ncbi:VWA domain-containing protein [Rhizobiales bacterium]|uniref:vWA domain-containing protein n=1 Tax=Hongsoonwoonella zoysiae TaxID=2821844 RepID=UPI001560AAE1|nr:VWA domain-containing protein [Hongsoonwoonella zoysiae]NRG18727.1 VWA domain-containing protein [Hongsoonwoonella zoysiae]
MSTVTRFPARASGVAERVSGFMAHLRLNGMKAGPGETADALGALALVDAVDPDQARLALKTLIATGAEDWRRFDDLFDAYWFNAGRQHREARQSTHIRTQLRRPTIWQPHFGVDADGNASSEPESGSPGSDDEGVESTEGRLLATRTDAFTRKDLRELMNEETLRRAEIIAHDLARAIRDRRSRRRKAARKGVAPDMRRIIRKSLARGGDPLDLAFKRRPDRPMRIVALADVSGSMSVYARVFLSFVKGLVSAEGATEAYLFHTRLMRVTPALRDRDALRSAARLSLMAEGFGGGTDIAGSLSAFADAYAAKALNRRTVVIILSDGYCTSEPRKLAAALARIRRKAGRIVWLNPLKGWRDFAPVAAGISAALPYLDAHLPANTLEALSALEGEFAKL